MTPSNKDYQSALQLINDPERYQNLLTGKMNEYKK